MAGAGNDGSGDAGSAKRDEPTGSAKRDEPTEVKEESTGTVLLALTVNAVIAVGKIAVGMLSGSSAMLSEGAHSVADTLNEGFLLTALRRSKRKADVQHPFGYGKERFFWALIAAVGIFVAGAGFSFIEAYQSLLGSGGGGSESFLASYIVLGVAFLLEGSSFLKAIRQVRGEAEERGRGIVEHIRITADPTVKTVASEDSAALVGLVLAATGLVLHEVTGSAKWEGLASLLIGLLLVFVAYALARDTKGLLIGEAAPEETRVAIRRQIEGYAEVDEVVDLMTMRMGSNRVLLAVRLDLVETLSSNEIETVSARIDRELHESFPQVYQVFLDATNRAGEEQSGLRKAR